MEIWNGKRDEFWAILDTHAYIDRPYNLHHTKKSYQNKDVKTQTIFEFLSTIKGNAPATLS